MEFHLLQKREPLNITGVDETTPFCDWRITADGCYGGQAVAYMYVAHLVLCSIFFLLCCWILYDRVVRKHQKICDFSRREMAIQPKPTEMFILNAAFFFFFRGLLAVVVFTNIGPGDMVARENWGNVAWNFAASALVFYLAGLIFATPHSYNDIEMATSVSSPYLPSPLQLNILMLALILVPIVLNQSLASAAGFAFHRGDIGTYNILVTSLYVMWGVVAGSVMSLYIFFGRQLLSILSRNIEAIQSSNQYMAGKNNVYAQRLREVKASYRKIRGVVFLMFVMLPVLLFVILALAFFRVEILRQHNLSYFFAVMWINSCALAIGSAVVVMGFWRRK
ncbi:uncharacterized protein VTP21DRAFT_2742 [Calcarisporiella thermophila]|uniref:uncharacterized protein n=1 Tax=Calcarisporiella thermophila TaxID=911321 RepID=UPI0037427AA6